MYARSVGRRTRKRKTAAARVEVQWDRGALCVPAWVVDHDSYRRWARSDEFPETGRIAFLNGIIWVDVSMEQVFSHVDVKTEIATVLRSLVRQEDHGYLFADGTLVFHPGAGVSNEPDACFISYESVQSGAAKWVKGTEIGYVEVEGTPDMVLEVVSDSSLQKDTVHLRELYWKAGVAEYWLVDARGSESRSSRSSSGTTGATPRRAAAKEAGSNRPSSAAPFGSSPAQTAWATGA
jgi:Uma2 family endonuclease